MLLRPMLPLSLKAIARLCGADATAVPDVVARGIATDSRQLKSGEVFAAIKSETDDGHRFVAAAAAAGACAALVSERVEADLPLLRVPDVVKAYQAIARAYRESLPMRVIAITGSNGKTSTKEFVASVLSRRHHVLKTEKNFNNHLGVPLMLLRATPDVEFAVLEMGMNHFGEIHPLCEMARPEVAIVTNIGTAHIEHLGSSEGIAREKGDLPASVPKSGLVILHADDDFTTFLRSRSAAPVQTVGIHAGDIRAEKVAYTRTGMHFEICHVGQCSLAQIHALGEHMVVNALFGAAVGLHFGLSLAECVAGLAEARLVGGRLEPREAAGLHFLDDSYNANPESMRAALRTLARIPLAGRRIAVFGCMGELGDLAEAGHRRVGAYAAEEGIDRVIAVGDSASWYAESARSSGVPHVDVCADTNAAADLLREVASPADLILVKGSRSARMERIFSHLEQG